MIKLFFVKSGIVFYKIFQNAMLVILICFFYSSLPAQVVPDPLTKKIDSDTSQKGLYYLYYKNQLDLIDLAYIVLHKDQSKRLDSTGIKNTNFYVTLAR